MAESDRTRWNSKYERGAGSSAEPSSALVGLAAHLPTCGRALDLAGGAGANALWLARRGLEVSLVDIADVGLARARQRATEAGLELALLRADLELDPFPPGPWQLIFCSHYLQRSLIARAAAELGPGGRLVWIHPTRTNLERHPKPSARFLLEPGEARALVLATGLTLDVDEEGWWGEGPEARHLARVVAVQNN